MNQAIEHNYGDAPSVRFAYNGGPENVYPAIRKQDWPAPTVRLAATTAMLHEHGDAARRYPHHKDYPANEMNTKVEEVDSPAVRLACCPVSENGGANSVAHHLNDCGLGKAVAAPSVRLAHVDGAQGDGVLAGKDGKGPKMLVTRHAPALLVSYVYVEPFLKNRANYCYRDWVLDSGAFSAHNSGMVIELNQYIDFCLKLMSEDPTLTEIFALDVVGDHEASIKNTEEMWRQGVPAIPCYHAGEPEDALMHIAKMYPKIALGGVALERADKKLRWAEQCFARVWPKKIHGFAYCTEAAILGLPFHSVDATSWEIGPCAFGNWEKFGNMSVRGSSQDLRSQVIHYLELEEKAQVKWANQMALLDQLAPTDIVLGKPSVRLAVRSSGREEENLQQSQAAPSVAPSVRMALLEQQTADKINMTSNALAVGSDSQPAQVKKKTKESKPKPQPIAKKTSADLVVDDKWANWRPS